MVTLAETNSEHKSRRFRPAGLCDVRADAAGHRPRRCGLGRINGVSVDLAIDQCSLFIERGADDQGNPDNNSSSLEIGTGLLEETTVTESNSPVTTYYLVDGNNPTGYAQVIEQSATPGTPTITYIWGGSLISQENAAGTTNAGIYYLIAGGQGSTQVLVNSTGSVVQDYYFDGFGNAIGFTVSNAITDYLYNQQLFDVISGQYYCRARNYDPATGTFTQQDTCTINPGDTANANLYLYAGADPINMFDPSGHDLMETLGSIAIGMVLNAGITQVAGAIALQFHDMQRAMASASTILNSFSVNLFASPFGTHAFGFSLGLSAGAGTGFGLAFSFTNYWQLLPGGQNVNFQ